MAKSERPNTQSSGVRHLDNDLDDNRVISFKRKKSSSRFKGVLYVKRQRKWRAQLCFEGKKKYLGSFDSEIEAAVARDEEVKKTFGHRKDLMNFPQDHPVHREETENEVLRSERERRFLSLLKDNSHVVIEQ